jgi:CRP-like cAMP-binding protein
VLYIEKGRIKLAVMTRNGKEVICGLLDAGAFVGEDVLSGRNVRRESAIAMIPTEVLEVPKAQMQALLRVEPAMRDRLMAHIVTRSARLEAHLADQLLNLSEERLAHTLLELAGCDQQRICKCVLPHVSQETIAEMVGTTRSRVNVFMGKFKRLGFIEDDGGMLLVKPSLLRAVHREPIASKGISPARPQALTSVKDHRAVER